MVAVPPWYLDKCRACGITDDPEQNGALGIAGFLKSSFWLTFWKQVIQKNGMHIFIIGQTYSGKTQKSRHLLRWIAPKETIIYMDTGKPEDMLLLFTLGKPVQILVPYGCRMELRGNLPCEVLITPVFDPKQYWKEIKKDWINVISIQNYFLEEDNHRRYVREMFKNYLLDAKLGNHNHFTPCTIVADEAQSILGSGRVSASHEAKLTGQDMANIMRQIRAMKERWMIISQSYYDIVGGARENAPCYVVCRGTKVDRNDNWKLKYLSGFALECDEKNFWVVMPSGRHFGPDHPLDAPLYEIPPVRVIYRGFVDEISDGQNMEELWTQADPGVFAPQMVEPEAEPVIPSRYEIFNGGLEA
jgi:hypothetical protein